MTILKKFEVSRVKLFSALLAGFGFVAVTNHAHAAPTTLTSTPIPTSTAAASPTSTGSSTLSLVNVVDSLPAKIFWNYPDDGGSVCVSSDSNLSELAPTRTPSNQTSDFAAYQAETTAVDEESTNCAPVETYTFKGVVFIELLSDKAKKLYNDPKGTFKATVDGFNKKNLEIEIAGVPKGTSMQDIEINLPLAIKNDLGGKFFILALDLNGLKYGTDYTFKVVHFEIIKAVTSFCCRFRGF